MKSYRVTMVVLLLTFGCRTNTTNNETDSQQLSEVEMIAQAYGIDNFDHLKQLQYTFNVARNDTLLVARKWRWNKDSGAITMIMDGDTITYQQSNVTEELKKVDHSFINDKYWLLFPLQLVWDKDMTFTNLGAQTAPISGKQLTKLTIQYGKVGGYTPGDAYDLYLDKNWLIQEWEFRKSGKESPGSAISWEEYADFNGIKVATNHLNKDSGLRIYFTDIKFE